MTQDPGASVLMIAVLAPQVAEQGATGARSDRTILKVVDPPLQPQSA